MIHFFVLNNLFKNFFSDAAGTPAYHTTAYHRLPLNLNNARLSTNDSCVRCTIAIVCPHPLAHKSVSSHARRVLGKAICGAVMNKVHGFASQCIVIFHLLLAVFPRLFKSAEIFGRGTVGFLAHEHHVTFVVAIGCLHLKLKLDIG